MSMVIGNWIYTASTDLKAINGVVIVRWIDGSTTDMKAINSSLSVLPNQSSFQSQHYIFSCDM